MKQSSITILVPVISDKVQDLLDQLKEIKDSPQDGISKDLDQLNVIHYARWVVIDHGKSWINDDQIRVPKLLFVIDCDGDEQSVLNEICEILSLTLDQIYVHCEGYPNSNLPLAESRSDFLTRHIIKDAAVYIGAPGRSVKQIQDENRLRIFIRGYLDSRSWSDVSAKTVHKKIQEAVSASADFPFLQGPKISMPRINYLALILIGLIALPFLIIIVPLWILILHFFHEKKDENFTLKRSQLDEVFMKDLEEYEDFTNQNQFTQLVDMKAGKFRLITIKAMFILTNVLIKFVFNQGKLMGIPTIHFAKWVMFEQNSRVLFFSNFDGSWQQYLGDFIDNSGWGLTGIFSNTKVFPKTNFLITGGAYLEENFLAWSRNSELVTNFWYAAYPDLSIKNVNNNTKIRVGLSKSLSEKQAANYLKLI